MVASPTDPPSLYPETASFVNPHSGIFLRPGSQRLPMLLHDLGEQGPVGGRGVGHGVGPGPDGAEDGILRGAAGGDDGDASLMVSTAAAVA